MIPYMIPLSVVVHESEICLVRRDASQRLCLPFWFTSALEVRIHGGCEPFLPAGKGEGVFVFGLVWIEGWSNWD